MTDDIPATAFATIRHVLETMLPDGCAIRSLEQGDAAGWSIRLRIRVKRLPATIVPLNIRIVGWGAGFERASITLRTYYDPAKDLDDAVAETMADLADRIFDQRALAQDARRHGLAAPQAGSDLTTATGHLVIDPDAVRTLADMLGSERQAQAWLREQMGFRRSEIEAPQRVTIGSDTGLPKPSISVIRNIVRVEFRLNPLALGHRDEGDTISHWSDDTCYVVGALPDTVTLQVQGHLLGEIVSGTAIGHRRIESMVATGADTNSPAFLAFALHTPRLPFDQLAPRI